jgi:hypothetical protein
MNNIPLDIFLNEYYHCDSGNGNTRIDRQKINCKHWSTDSSGCEIKCALNVLNNPKWTDCLKCEKRERVVDFDKSKFAPKKLSSEQVRIQEPSLLKKVISYGKAEASQFINGKVSDEIYNKRKETCLACDYKLNPVPETEPIGWCKGGCGCKVGNPRAALSQKLYMPTIACPLKKFGPEVGNGFNVVDAFDSLKGAATAINETIKPDTEENK